MSPTWQRRIPLALFFLLSACAYKVPLLRMKPAELEVARIQKLGIYPVVSGVAEAEALEKTAEKIKETLRLRGFFSEVRLVRNPARELWGLDALLHLLPHHFAVSTDSGEYEERVWEETGRKIKETYVEDGVEKTREVPEKVLRVYTVPYVAKKIVTRLELELKNLRSGRRSASRVFANRYGFRIAGRESIRRLPSDENLLLDAVNSLLPQIADALVPHLVGEKVKLATHADCQKGVELLKRGDWRGALASWEGVVQADPSNHAAHYNIGIAHEALKNYAPAMSAYQTALGLSNRRMYRAAIERLQVVMEEAQRAQKQMEGRK